MFQILVCYLPGRTFSIISPSVGAECSCLVSLRAKNHIWRTQFRRTYRGGSAGHMFELRRSPTQEHTQTHTHKTHTQYMASKMYTIRHFDLSKISNNHITFEASTNSVLLCRARDNMKDILNQTKYVSRQSSERNIGNKRARRETLGRRDQTLAKQYLQIKKKAENEPWSPHLDISWVISRFKNTAMECLCNAMLDKAPMRHLKTQKVFANTIRPEVQF